MKLLKEAISKDTFKYDKLNLTKHKKKVRKFLTF